MKFSLTRSFLFSLAADIYKKFFQRLKPVLWALWGFVTLSLFIAMCCFEGYLPQNFGAAAHDGFILYPLTKIAVAILPVNGKLVKPQGTKQRREPVCCR